MITRRDVLRITTRAALGAQIAALHRDIRALARDLETPRIAAPRRPPLALAAELGLSLDPWQRDALTTEKHHVLLRVARQGGKGVVASILAIDELLSVPGSKTLVVSRTEDQAKRLLSRIKGSFFGLSNTPQVITNTVTELGLITGSRVLAVPGAEESIRGIDAVDLLIVDEGSLVPDDLYGAVRPMLATTDGRQVLLSTPRGKRGFFHRIDTGESPEWHRVKVVAAQIPRIKASFLERERRDLGEFMYRQEYDVEYLDLVDQLYPTDLVMAALSLDIRSLGLPTFGVMA